VTIFAHLTDDPPARFYLPDLFYTECANILWKVVQRFGYPAAPVTEPPRDAGFGRDAYCPANRRA
jgi:hypothetical protein